MGSAAGIRVVGIDFGGRPLRLGKAEFKRSRARIARSIRSRSDRRSESILVSSMWSPEGGETNYRTIAL